MQSRGNDPWEHIRDQERLRRNASYRREQFDSLPMAYQRAIADAKQREIDEKKVQRRAPMPPAASSTTKKASVVKSDSKWITPPLFASKKASSPASTTTASAPQVDQKIPTPYAPHFPDAKEMQEFRLQLQKKEQRDAEAKRRLAESKASAKTSVPKPEWNRQVTFAMLTQKYTPFYGRNLHEPDLDNVLPAPVSREDAFQQISQQETLKLGITHIVTIKHRLFVIGMTGSMATVALELLDLHPRFWMTLPPESGDDGKPKTPEQLIAILNQPDNWPPDWGRQFGQDLLPVTQCSIESRNISVRYRENPHQNVFKLEFANMVALHHYRKYISANLLSIGLQYQPQLFHEQENLVQMYQSMVDYTYFDWVEVPVADCHLSPPNDWDTFEQLRASEDARIFNVGGGDGAVPNGGGNHVDNDHKRDSSNSLNSLNLMNNFSNSSNSSNSTNSLNSSNKSRFLGTGAPKTKRYKASDLPNIWTKCHLEGRVSFQKLKALPAEQKGAPLPLVVPLFDIETLSWKQVEMQRELMAKSGIKATPAPINDPDDQADQAKGRFVELFQATREKLNTNDAATTEMFPVARNEQDAVAVIATTFIVYGDTESFIRVIHCLGKLELFPEDLHMTIVYSFDEDNERGMLEHWSTMIQGFHTPWLGGYNSIPYDLPFLYERSHVLDSVLLRRNLSLFLERPYKENKQYRNVTQCRPRPAKGALRNTSASSTSHHDKNKPKMSLMPLLETPGITQFDLLKPVKGMNGNMDDYKLKTVGAYYAGDDKVLKTQMSKRDMPYQMISPYWASGAAYPYYRRKLAIYCLFDVRVTEMVLVKGNLSSYLVEVSRESCSTDQQMFQGQQIKIWSKMLKECHKQGRLLDEQARQQIQLMYDIPSQPLLQYQRQGMEPEMAEWLCGDKSDEKAARREAAYQGATVLDPKIGYYKDCVSVADFASLYPSIIRAHNLCFSTWIEARYDSVGAIYFPEFDQVTVDTLTGKLVLTSRSNRYVMWDGNTAKPTDAEVGTRVLILVLVDRVSTGLTCCFVQNRGSFFPEILKSLMDARSAVKVQMEQAELVGDTFTAAVCDAKQAAIKVICNSAYGFCGARAGFFGTMVIAIATCLIGRMKIMQTKFEFEKLGAEIVYGDTDSVFAQWPALSGQTGKTPEEIEMEVRCVSTRACNRVSGLLPHPMKLEFEKCMKPFLLIKKKMYVGNWFWPKPKFFCKGTPNVRRDSCQIARDCIRDTFKAVLTKHDDTNHVLAPLRAALVMFRDPKMSLLHLKKSVAKKPMYATDNLIQVQLFKKLEARRGTPIDPGTRVPFVIALPRNGTRPRFKNEKVTFDAEDVQYMIDHKIRADRSYYLEKQIWKPLGRFLCDTRLVPQETLDSLVKPVLEEIRRQDQGNATISTSFRKSKEALK